jgi:hypothetical protein
MWGTPPQFALQKNYLSEIPLSNNQMVNTRSGVGQDVPLVIHDHITNQVPPPPEPTMDPVMQ